MRFPWPLPLLLLVPGVAASASPAASLLPSGELVLRDAVGDDHGPGTYRYPIDSRLPVGSFDLTEVRLGPDQDRLAVELCFRVRPARVPGVHLTQYETAALLPQAVDLYLDRDGVPGSGQTRALPGREVTLHPDFAWEHALVVVPRQIPFGAYLRQVAPELAARTLVTDRVRQSGRCLRTSFPLAPTGAPAVGWGVTVLVSGARFVASFQLGDRLRGEDRSGALTREILPIPSSCNSEDLDSFDCTFGGCAPCGSHPRVLDALGCQADAGALARYDPATGRLAVVGGVRVGPGETACPPPAEATTIPAPPASPAPVYRIVAIGPGVVSLTGGSVRCVGELGEVVDEEGRGRGTLVVTGTAGSVTLTQPLGDPAALAPGLEVRF